MSLINRISRSAFCLAMRARSRAFGGSSPTYADLMVATDSRGVERGYLSTDERFGVLFWRARAERQRLLVQIEVSAAHAAAATAALIAAVRSSSGLECEVEAVTPGTLVPEAVLTGVLGRRVGAVRECGQAEVMIGRYAEPRCCLCHRAPR